jgi:hypothetical protein
MIQFYEGNKSIELHRPVLIVVVNAADVNTIVGEYFIFTGWTRVLFLAQFTGIQDQRGQGLPEPYKSSSELAHIQHFSFGRDALEAKVHEIDPTLHERIFWQGANFEWIPTSDMVVMNFALRNLYSREISSWVDQSRFEEVAKLRERYRLFRRLNFLQNDLIVQTSQ